MSEGRSRLDPITLQIIGGALSTIAKEMGYVLYRMAYSSIIRESEDLGAGIFDLELNTLCESDSTPMHIGSIPGYLEGALRNLDVEQLRPGDVIIHNHPYHGASHSPDIAVIMPVFYEGRLIAYSANTAHHLDIGAATPGIMIDVVDVFSEGMLMNAVKLFEEGKRNETIWSFIRGNTRTPMYLEGDLEAQVASVRLGARRYVELLDRYGRETVLQAERELMDYSERMMRKALAEVPDGEYYAEGYLDDDGKNRDKPLKVSITVRIQGDSAEVDFEGSSPQVETAFNVPFSGSTRVAMYFVFRAILLDTAVVEEYVPQNQGSFRPFRVKAPEGSIYNPRFPASCEARFAQVNKAADLVIKALAPVIPERVTAGNSATLSFISYSGTDPETGYWIFLEVNEGSYGGRPVRDGVDSVDCLIANTRNNPVEDLGMHLPLVCDRYELRDGDAAAGEFRGGIGIVKEQRFLKDGIITHEADGHFEAPWGFRGGESGRPGRVVRYNVADREGSWTDLPAKFSGIRCKAGDVIRIETPCAGGYGDPLDREPQRVWEDVLDGFTSEEKARGVYGVVFAAEGPDLDATERERQRLREARGRA